ncbi:hypothetical protein D3C87_2090170 [compost metagenome]
MTLHQRRWIDWFEAPVTDGIGCLLEFTKGRIVLFEAVTGAVDQPGSKTIELTEPQLRQ